MQWQWVFPTTSPQIIYFNFPITYPNAFFGGQATYNDAIGDITTPLGLLPVDTSTAAIYNGSGAGNVVMVITYGY